jgi:hypothetical protein
MKEFGNMLDRAVGFIVPFKRAITLGTIAVALAIAAVQTVRLEGFKVWPVTIEGWKPKAERYEATIEQVRIAQDVAAEKARLARLEQEARYRALAERIDDDAKQDMGRNTDAAERFIAAGGYGRCVRTEANRSAGSGTGTSAESNSAVDPVGAGGAPELDGTALIGVTADDVRICTANTVKAEAAKTWAEGVN